MSNPQPLNLLSIENKNIEECIYNIRDQQVMLDSDIAFFFGIETKNLNKQMKRNIERFPDDFCFQLNSKEFKNLRFQNGTSNYGGRRYLPYVYTEEGIITLTGVLKNDIAAKMSVEIARKFIQMRKFILENGDEFVAVSENDDLERIDDLEKELRNALAAKDDTLAAAISVAIYDPKVDNNFEDTFKRANSKMYQNKKEIKGKGKK